MDSLQAFRGQRIASFMAATAEKNNQIKILNEYLKKFIFQKQLTHLLHFLF
jgi:hypothetical protein